MGLSFLQAMTAGQGRYDEGTALALAVSYAS
jgi:hypothetical protein